MTGFGRVEAKWQDYHWTWELRAVNGKGLDIRLRLPQGFERLEADVKKACSKQLSRGNVQITLSMVAGAAASVPTLNKPVLN